MGVFLQVVMIRPLREPDVTPLTAYGKGREEKRRPIINYSE